MEVEKSKIGQFRWQRRSRLERSLIILLHITSILIAIITLCAVVYLYMSLKNASLSRVCTTADCVQAANEIILSLNESVDPCDDFYEFACGGFLEKQFLEEYQMSQNRFSILDHDLKIKLKKIIEDPNIANDLEHMNKSRTYYKSCMDTDKFEEQGTKPLLELLDVLGGWPVLLGDKWDESKFDWIDALIKYRALGFKYRMIFTVSVEPDYKNISRNVLMVKYPSNRGMMRGSFDQPAHPSVKAYKDFMVRSALILGAQNETRVREEMEQAFSFEHSLSKKFPRLAEVKDTNLNYNKMKIKDLKQRANNTDWMRLLQSLVVDPPIDEEEEVVVSAIDYIISVDSQLAEDSARKRRPMANYMMWLNVMDMMSYLDKRCKENRRTYLKLINGQQVEDSRWRGCLLLTDLHFGHSLSSIYVKRYSDSETKGHVQQLVHYVRDEFLASLKETDWADKRTVDYAIEKTKEMRYYIGFPDELINDTLIEKFYEDINHSAYCTSYDQKKIGGDSSKRTPSMRTTISTLILQDVFFQKNRPNYMNFGRLGFIIGHELTHGFDNTGRTFDKDGQLHDWWTVSSDTRFRERARCVIDQYSNFTLPENNQIRVNGLLTQGENIADNGAVKLAYRANRRWLKNNYAEPSLPGLKYTNDQLFWISLATNQCAKKKPEWAVFINGRAPHSPNKFRVIGPLRNSKKFSDSFNCKLGDPMNPVNKCAVW